MKQITKAIESVRILVISSGNFSGNAEEALYMLEKCGSIRDTLLRLEWAEQNCRIAAQKIKDALKEVRELENNKKLDT
jgi:hypothetical protein